MFADTDRVILDDLLNPHPGKIVRVNGDPNSALSYNVAPFTGADALPIIDRMTQSLEYTNGTGPNMMAISASDLNSVTATAANQRANSSQLIVESVARFFSETGMRYLVRIVCDQLVQKPEEANLLITRLMNQSVPIDEFTSDFDVNVSVGFSTSTRDQAIGSLNALLMQQIQLVQMNSPVVSHQNIYATLAKLTEAQGQKNVAAYATDPSTLPPPPPPQPTVDPNAGLIQVETLKAQLKAQSDSADREFETWKVRLQDDRERDRDRAEEMLKAREMELKYQAQVDVARIKIEQDRQRYDVDDAIAAQDALVQQKQMIAQAAQAAQAQFQQPQPMPDQMAPPPQEMPQQPNPMEYPQ